jgi:hypothetical protein
MVRHTAIEKLAPSGLLGVDTIEYARHSRRPRNLQHFENGLSPGPHSGWYPEREFDEPIPASANA